MKPLFVTGTDTGVGKTTVAAALMHALGLKGLKVAGMKPVASGCDEMPEGLRSADALALQQQATVRTRYPDVNPYAFAPAIAPHIASREAGIDIELEVLERAYERLDMVADVVVVEGAGGWLTPINRRETLADFALALDARVVLVVGLRLGCLNHAFLTARSIEATGLRLCGWVANQIDPNFSRLEENVRALELRLPAPRLALIAHETTLTPATLAGNLKVDALLGNRP